MQRTSDKQNFIHFADDTTVYMSGRDLTVLYREVCEELNAIDEWLKANRLSLNTDKTYFMIHTINLTLMTIELKLEIRQLNMYDRQNF